MKKTLADTALAGKARAGKALKYGVVALCLPTVFLQSPFLPTASAATYDLKEQTPAVQTALAGRQGRFAQLVAAKAQGAVGENAQGLVSQLGGGSDLADLVAAENRDRLVIYRAIVEQNALPPQALATVQHVFAETQRDRAAVGDRIQLPSGEWTTK